jgi:molybdopterin-guanine dinucleotide biosynthesis protein A
VRSAVLAGGAARRFAARPKGLEAVGDRRIIDVVVDVLTEASGALPFIVARDESTRSVRPDLELVTDQLPGRASVIGIHAAVSASDGPVLVAAWDMPFLDPALLRLLCERAAEFDAYLPESRGPRGCEPLCAVYAPSCVEPIARAVAAGDLRTTAFHPEVRVGRLPLAEVERFGNPDELFFNVNAPEELAAARAVQRRRTRTAQDDTSHR